MFAVLALRAGQLQIFPDSRLSELRDRQFESVLRVQSRRGSILDRQGRELAVSTPAVSVFLDPGIVESPKALAQAVQKNLGWKPREIRKLLQENRHRRFVWLARKLPPESVAGLRKMGIRGLGFVDEYRRHYPNRSLAAQVLGIVGRDGEGLEGLEHNYNAELAGNSVRVNIKRDARGRPLVVDGKMLSEGAEGADLHLTLDSEFQHLLEAELVRAVKENSADSAVGVILDVKTSAILAMAGVPNFDPNLGGQAPPEIRRNRAIADAFEPGSTLKTFALAAALAEGVVAPNTSIDTENGSFRLGDRVIREASANHRWPELSVAEVLAFSSNVGTAKIALKLGSERLKNKLEDFGFGARTGVDFPGEARGSLQNLPWNPHLLANISFGHGISASPLQIANAYAAIANGGILHQPYLVEEIKGLDLADKSRGDRRSHDPRRVLTVEQAKQMRLLLTAATAEGSTGYRARVDGFVVAGKTGTAQKVDLQKGGYLPGAYISSFAGFFPSENPRFVIYVAVDEPRNKDVYYGSTVAAPLFSRLASFVSRRENLPQSSLRPKQIASLSTLPPGSRAPTGDLNPNIASPLFWEEADPEQGYIMPDLSATSVRSALRKLRGMSVHVKVSGMGTVHDTAPGPGSRVQPGDEVHLRLR